MKDLVLSDIANADLKDIWLYSVRQWSRAQADKYIIKMLSTCDDLAAGVRKGRAADDVRSGLYRFFVESHVIYFRVEAPNDLIVVRILHQSMDAPNQL